jgi:hypothetical protein
MKFVCGEGKCKKSFYFFHEIVFIQFRVGAKKKEKRKKKGKTKINHK